MTQISIQSASAGRAVRGIYFMLLSVFLFSLMDALIKWVSATHPVGQIIFFRNVFAFVPVFFVLRQAGGGLAVLRTRHFGGHLMRGAMGILSMVCIFGAFSLMPLGEAVALSLSAPLFVTVLSVPLLGERVGIRRWSAAIVGFAGILVMTRPGTGVFHPVALLAVGGALFYALAVISIRRLSTADPPATIVFYFTAFAAAAGAVSLPFQWVTPDAVGLALLVSIGLLGGIAQLALTQAFRLAPVALVAPFDYGALVFAVLFGYAVWGDVPDGYIVVGAAIVVASGLYILHREIALGRVSRTGAEEPT
jgi:drug/metabolite transporter (DMT)-like permease